LRLLQRFADEGRDAKILAGGQSLMPMLAMRMARPEVLIDLRKLSGLDYVRGDRDGVAIGAMTPKRSAEDSTLLRQRQPLFHAATCLVGDRAVRNRGTVGGSFAHADPAAEYPAAALVLGMEFTASAPGGERRIAGSDFFVSYMTTSLEATEILTEVRVPGLRPGDGWAIQEFARRHGDLALAGVATTLRLARGKCVEARLAAFGVGPTAVRLAAAEHSLLGQVADSAAFSRAAAAAAAALDEPTACVHASAEYRRHLVGVLVKRTLEEACSRAT
jgi:CO/xanthine dehydrogenase FAD-binding subunit